MFTSIFLTVAAFYYLNYICTHVHSKFIIIIYAFTLGNLITNFENAFTQNHSHTLVIPPPPFSSLFHPIMSFYIIIHYTKLNKIQTQLLHMQLYTRH